MRLKSFLIITTFMTLAINIDVFSNEDTSIYYEYDGIKFDNSIDIEEIKQLPIELLETMKNSEGLIKSLGEQNVNFEDSLFQKEPMSTNDFSMFVWVEDTAENIYDPIGIDRLKFNAQGTWHTNPFYEFTDVIALSWSDDFTLDSYNCTIDGDNSRAQASTIAPEKGIACEVDLQLGNEDRIILLTADVYKFVDDTNTNTTDFSGEYGHVQIKPSVVSIEFNEDNTISMSTSFGTKLIKALPSYTSFIY